MDDDEYKYVLTKEELENLLTTREKNTKLILDNCFERISQLIAVLLESGYKVSVKKVLDNKILECYEVEIIEVKE